VGKKGTAAARAAERERVGTLGIVGVHPAQHGVGPPARAQGHLAGAAVLSDVKQSKGPLAGAGMRRIQGQVAQVLWRLTPARIVNA
jgi:hypothetical protein